MIRKILLAWLLMASIAQADTCYLGQWAWNTDNPDFPYWDAPLSDQCTGRLDLRNLTQMSKLGGTSEGYAVFCYPTNVNHASLVYRLFDNIDESVPANVRNKIKNYLGISTVNGITWREVWWDIMTLEADPTGLVRWKPLMPKHDLTMELRLGKMGVIHSAKLIPGESPEWKNVLAVLHEDYRRGLDGDYILLAKQLDAWEEKYGLSYQVFIPDDAKVKLASIPHETTQTEDWNCSDSDNPDCDLNWTEFDTDVDISSNALLHNSTNSGAGAYVVSSLSSDDHYAQLDFPVTSGTSSGTEQNFGVLTRHTGSATLTTYQSLAQDGASENCAVLKYVSGSATWLDTQDCSTELPGAYVLKGTSNGSTISMALDGVTKASLTDTSITGNLNCGVRGFRGASAATISVDNFTCEDLPVAGERRMFLVQ